MIPTLRSIASTFCLQKVTYEFKACSIRRELHIKPMDISHHDVLVMTSKSYLLQVRTQ